MAVLLIHSSILPPVFRGLAAIKQALREPSTIILPADMAEAQPEVAQYFDNVLTIPGTRVDFIDSSLVEIEIFRAHAEQPFSLVASTGELGVLRAARFREAAGLPGQSLASALAYRDKVLMKDICARAGVRVPRYKAIDGPSDLLAFVRHVGLPIVLKPRAGAGSIDTQILSTEDELLSALTKMRAATAGLSMSFLAEEFINGQLYNVNGYASPDGQLPLVWPAQYLERGNLEMVLNEGTVSGEYLLDRNDPLVGPMVEFTKQCLHALPWPAGGFAFHLELFLSDDTGELIFCEVASRPGGGNIDDVYQNAFGVSLHDAALRLQFGLPVPKHDSAPRHIVGSVQTPVRTGTFHLESTEPPPFSWVEKYDARIKSGDKATGPKNCADSSANILVSGETAREVVARLNEVAAWHASVARWSEEVSG